MVALSVTVYKALILLAFFSHPYRSLAFTHFVEFFSFRKIGENHKEKSLVKKVTVVVALDLGTGNTKNLEYENE